MNYYARAIELLATEQDWKAIAIDYAKRYPAHFTRVAEDSHFNRQSQIVDMASLVHRVRGLLDADRKIEAIKLCRNELRIGLKEAKEYVEALAS